MHSILTKSNSRLPTMASFQSSPIPAKPNLNDILQLHAFLLQLSSNQPANQFFQDSRHGLIAADGTTINAQEGGVHVSQPLTVINYPNYFPPASPKSPGLVNTFNFRLKLLPSPWLQVSEHLELMQLRLDRRARPEIYLITGINGSGKSTLASYYALQWLPSTSKKNIIWLNASSSKTLEMDLKSLYAVLDVGPFPQNIEAAINLVLELLREFPTLLIFDDAADLKSIEEYLPRRICGSDNFFIIVTSQNSAFFGDVVHDPASVIHLDPVTPERRDVFLAGIINGIPNGLEYHAKEGEEFAGHFDSLLAPLVSGMKALRKKNQNLAMFTGEIPGKYTLKEFNAEIARWIATEKTMDCIDPDDPDHPREILFKPLRNLWDIEFKRFKGVGYGLTGMAVLDAAAFMSPEGQPVDWMHAVCHDEAEEATRNAVAYLQTRSLVKSKRVVGGGAVVAHKVVSMARRCLKERNKDARDKYVRKLLARIEVARTNENYKLISTNVEALKNYMDRNKVIANVDAV